MEATIEILTEVLMELISKTKLARMEFIIKLIIKLKVRAKIQ